MPAVRPRFSVFGESLGPHICKKGYMRLPPRADVGAGSPWSRRSWLIQTDLSARRFLLGNQTEAESTGRAQLQAPGSPPPRRGPGWRRAPRPERAPASQRARAGRRAAPRRPAAGQPAPRTPGRRPGELVCYSWVCRLRLHGQVRAEKHSAGVSRAHGWRRRPEAGAGPGLDAGWTCRRRRRSGPTPGVSFLKPVRGKQSRSVWFGFGADARSGARPRRGLPRAAGLGVEGEGLMLRFPRSRSVSSLGLVLVNPFFILLDLVT